MASAMQNYSGENGQGLAPIEEYLPFVKRVAQRLARRLPSHIALEDLVSDTGKGPPNPIGIHYLPLRPHPSLIPPVPRSVPKKNPHQ